MKQLILILIALFLILLSQVEATELELGVNLITMHTMDRNEQFSNKVDAKGILMTNSFQYIGLNKKYYLLKGEDSVGSKMAGGFYTFDNNIIIGGYSYNKKDWKAKKMKNTLGDSLGFIPIIGYKWTENLAITEDISLKSNVILTPVIVNWSIGIQINF